MNAFDWLRLLAMIFYAPARGIREVRDRASLASAGLVALLVHAAFFFTLLYFGGLINPRRPLAILLVFFQSAGSLVFVALVFVPLALFLANLFERRASFRLLVQQEYSTLAATMFYALAASSLITTLLTIAGKFGGLQQVLGERLLAWFIAERSQLQPDMLPVFDEKLLRPEVFAAVIPLVVLFAVFAFWSMFVLRVVFRLSWLRAVILVLVSVVLLFPASFILLPLFTTILASPFLLLLLFLLLRGYVSEITRAQRARETFRQNLEAATLNPADSSAHYNLGLIHQQRGELDAARERFERAVAIDAEEVDAHYQLGRIARQQKRLADAIRHYEEVVSRDQAHAQHEIWREVGATYIAANQFEDARNALERFLARRSSDPEALYLMGRAHAGLGHRREAANSMEACIEAVKSGPAYKYRLEKRWLNEAQQFLRSQV
ncbi:MAG TPA: tetratricopeptide repeat protein [Pyrinomonadaceae bacterium]|nr:tetratricopeptide repeat protein [Pyrinomonadaceae bacterium]